MTRFARIDVPHQFDDYASVREGVRALCKAFGAEYWRELDERRGYPEEFVKTLTEAGWLAALIPEENLVGEEGLGFRYLLDGLNVERILVAAECIGDGYWFIEKASNYARQRVVFERPIGQNQGIQFPIARAYVNVEAANLMRFRAAALFDARKPCGAEANMILSYIGTRVLGMPRSF